MKSEKEIRYKLQKLKPKLRKDFSVTRMRLFGSWASGHADESSDIDLLIELEKPIGWRFFTLKLFLEHELGRPVDLVTKNALKEQLRDSILSEARDV